LQSDHNPKRSQASLSMLLNEPLLLLLLLLPVVQHNRACPST
jgi:hypothetical protein